MYTYKINIQEKLQTDYFATHFHIQQVKIKFELNIIFFPFPFHRQNKYAKPKTKYHSKTVQFKKIHRHKIFYPNLYNTPRILSYPYQNKHSAKSQSAC